LAFSCLCERGYSYARCIAKLFDGQRKAWLLCFQHLRQELPTDTAKVVSEFARYAFRAAFAMARWEESKISRMLFGLASAIAFAALLLAPHITIAQGGIMFIDLGTRGGNLNEACGIKKLGRWWVGVALPQGK
jgi:hypothetical protein